jgi:hypothetical protein
MYGWPSALAIAAFPATVDTQPSTTSEMARVIGEPSQT